MTQDSVSPQQAYDRLDLYLSAVFQLLEGIADIDEAARGIRKALESPQTRDLDRNLEALLYELFFAKCRKYFLRSAE